MVLTSDDVVCVRCRLKPAQLSEYVSAAIEWDYKTAAEYVIGEEGTFNKDNGHFLCTPCYIKADCPTAPNGWVAP